jgi:hypothetical protein
MSLSSTQFSGVNTDNDLSVFNVLPVNIQTQKETVDTNSFLYSQISNMLNDNKPVTLKTYTTEFSQQIKEKIEKSLNNKLTNKEQVNLLKELSKISIKHYNVQPNQYIAIQLTNGKIVAYAKTEWELLTSLQGKTFPSPIFTCKS